MNRQLMLQRLQDSSHPWDLLVIGGGATGLGIAWNASACGYRTLLLEAHDFAQGTSSRSTKLIHGGVRYLRQGQIGMVRSSLREREFLLQAAHPHVWPLNLVIPSYHRASRWYYYAGLKLYDLLAGKRNMQSARLLTAQRALEVLPTLMRDGLRGGVAFSDGQFDDARLAIAIAQTVAADGQSVLLNYAPVISLDTQTGSQLRLARFQDELTGEQHEVQARVIVNATGVFAERISRLEHQSLRDQHTVRISPSRGTHLVLPGSTLQSSSALMIPDTDDGRVLFAIPWLGHTLLGTTDVATHAVEIEPHATDQEIDYLLDHAGRYLTTRPQRKDVLSVFSGLRPLLGKSGSAVTSQLSREHEISISPGGLITIIGGKWTTFRKMGSDVLKLAIQVGGLQKSSCQTPKISVEYPQPEEFSREDLRPFDERLPICRADVVRAVRYEMAEKVDDVLSRRTRCLLLNAGASQEIAGTVIELMRSEKGFDSRWASQQLDDFTQLARGYQIAARS